MSYVPQAPEFFTADIADGSPTYVGKTSIDGNWMVQKVTDALVSYATVTNNPSVTTYSAAWTDKTTLVYGRFDEAF